MSRKTKITISVKERNNDLIQIADDYANMVSRSRSDFMLELVRQYHHNQTTKNHPLTNDFLAKNFSPFWVIDLEDFVYCSRDMRGVADMQLNRVIDFLQENHDPDNKYTLDTVASMLKEAMRPEDTP
jgi:hypothetical protein